uniref:Uncharacterized protein n=1 Tax=Aegilops tauschii subsp. strangulata TaxID=200361 RepID=A0A453L4P0_AEGTS
RVSVRSSSSSSRRRCALSSRFREPASPRRHAWVSLQGRLVGAEEAASADAAAPGLPPDEATAWELFSPMHRVLLVATVAAASSRSHAARRIEQLQRSIHFRDEVLQSMQQKLDDLLGEMHSLQQQYVKCDSFISTQSEKVELVSSKKLMDEEGTRCCACSQPVTAATPYKTKDFCGMDDAKSDVVDRTSVSLVDHEERRMSDLSDIWSVVSSVDNHLNGDNQVTKNDFSVAEVSILCLYSFMIIVCAGHIHLHVSMAYAFFMLMSNVLLSSFFDQCLNTKNS